MATKKRASSDQEGYIRQFSLEEIKRIHAEVETWSAELAGFIAAMEKGSKDVPPLDVNGGDRMYEGLQWLAKWLSRIQESYRLYRMRPGD